MSASESSANVDPAELAKFDAIAQRWWDPQRTLQAVARSESAAPAVHRARRAARRSAPCVDVGCGGGILSEAMARARRARARHRSVAAPASRSRGCTRSRPGRGRLPGDRGGGARARTSRRTSMLVTCMEMLEHVPDPAAMLAALASLVEPGGEVIVSTLNRHPRAFAVAIIGAEYIARVLPRGTHDYLKFIRPSELARWGRAAGLELRDLTGNCLQPAHPLLPAVRGHRGELPRAFPAGGLMWLLAAVLFDLDGTLARHRSRHGRRAELAAPRERPRAPALRAGARRGEPRLLAPGAARLSRMLTRERFAAPAAPLSRDLRRRVSPPETRLFPGMDAGARRARRAAACRSASSPTSPPGSPMPLLERARLAQRASPAW